MEGFNTESIHRNNKYRLFHLLAQEAVRRLKEGGASYKLHTKEGAQKAQRAIYEFLLSMSDNDRTADPKQIEMTVGLAGYMQFASFLDDLIADHLRKIKAEAGSVPSDKLQEEKEALARKLSDFLNSDIANIKVWIAEDKKAYTQAELESVLNSNPEQIYKDARAKMRREKSNYVYVENDRRVYSKEEINTILRSDPRKKYENAKEKIDAIKRDLIERALELIDVFAEKGTLPPVTQEYAEILRAYVTEGIQFGVKNIEDRLAARTLVSLLDLAFLPTEKSDSSQGAGAHPGAEAQDKGFVAIDDNPEGVENRNNTSARKRHSLMRVIRKIFAKKLFVFGSGALVGLGVGAYIFGEYDKKLAIDTHCVTCKSSVGTQAAKRSTLQEVQKNTSGHADNEVASETQLSGVVRDKKDERVKKTKDQNKATVQESALIAEDVAKTKNINDKSGSNSNAHSIPDIPAQSAPLRVKPKDKSVQTKKAVSIVQAKRKRVGDTHDFGDSKARPYILPQVPRELHKFLSVKYNLNARLAAAGLSAKEREQSLLLFARALSFFFSKGNLRAVNYGFASHRLDTPWGIDGIDIWRIFMTKPCGDIFVDCVFNKRFADAMGVKLAKGSLEKAYKVFKKIENPQ